TPGPPVPRRPRGTAHTRAPGAGPVSLRELWAASPGSITLPERTGQHFPALFPIRPARVGPAGEMEINSQDLGQVEEIPAPRRRASRPREFAGPWRRTVGTIMGGSSR